MHLSADSMEKNTWLSLILGILSFEVYEKVIILYPLQFTEVESLQGHEDWIQSIDFSTPGIFLYIQTCHIVLSIPSISLENLYRSMAA